MSSLSLMRKALRFNTFPLVSCPVRCVHKAAAAKTAPPQGALQQNDVLTANDVMQAYHRIKNTVARSPLDLSTMLSAKTGCNLFIKKEHNSSVTGSYKERGALNTMLQLTSEQKQNGVICSSAGNHAQAVSYHSTRLGIDGVIVMPQNTPFVKVRNTKAFGGRVVMAGESFQEAFQFAQKLCEHEGRTFIHAFDNPNIVAGAGTVAVEMLEQNPFLDAIIVPVGGGGLIAGMALFIKSINPRIKVYGVEAKAMPGMLKSVQAGKVESVPKLPTMADGIAIEKIGSVPLELIRKNVDDIVLVEEDELAAAVLMMLETEKSVVEASGAAGLAALMHGRLKLEGQNVGIVCTGSNIDMTLLGRIIEKGLVKQGRIARISVTIKDQPGQLAKVLAILADNKANVRDVYHERSFLMDTVGYTQPVVEVETKGFEHTEDLMVALKDAGFDHVSVNASSAAALAQGKGSLLRH